MPQENSGKNAGNSEDKPAGINYGARIISYNLREEERPDGIKVRFKIRIVSGKAAGTISARQAKAIKELLEWTRQQRGQEQQDRSR